MPLPGEKEEILHSTRCCFLRAGTTTCHGFVDVCALWFLYVFCGEPVSTIDLRSKHPDKNTLFWDNEGFSKSLKAFLDSKILKGYDKRGVSWWWARMRVAWHDYRTSRIRFYNALPVHTCMYAQRTLQPDIWWADEENPEKKNKKGWGELDKGDFLGSFRKRRQVKHILLLMFCMYLLQVTRKQQDGLRTFIPY